MSPPWTFSVPPDAAAWVSLAAALVVFAAWSFVAPWVSRHPRLEQVANAVEEGLEEARKVTS